MHIFHCLTACLPIHGFMQAVIFDLMDTLIPDPFRQAVLETAGSMQNFQKLKNTVAYLRFEKGEITPAEYLASFFRNSRAASEASFTANEFREKLFRTPQPFAGVEDLLQNLKTEYRIFIASNYSIWIDHHLKNLNWQNLFEEVFVSARMGVRKPSVEYFRCIEEKTGIDPAKTVFIDDRDDNLSAAEEQGFQVLKAVSDWPAVFYEKFKISF